MKLKQHTFISFEEKKPLEEVIEFLITLKKEYDKIGIKPVLYDNHEMFFCYEIDYKKEANHEKK